MVQLLANTVSKLGLTIRGSYGEGSKPDGAIYQLSNQVTLGVAEQAALDNLKSVALQIMREERAGREEICRAPEYIDRVWRSLGILKTARMLTRDEFMALISHLRTGVAMGLLAETDLDTVSALMTDAQPATLSAAAGEDLDPARRDAARARLVRERLSGVG